jgi:hypothetical protein
MFEALFLIEPIVKSDRAFGVLLDQICKFKTRDLSFSEYIMERRGANPELLGDSTLFFIIILHPFSKLIHYKPIFIFFSCTNIRNFDTLVRVSRKDFERNFFDKRIEKALTCIEQYDTMKSYVTQKEKRNEECRYILESDT